MKYIDQLRQIAPYIRAHQNITLIVLLPGDVQQQPHYPSIIKDLLLLHSVGIKLVTVFGCRPQIEAALADANITSTCIGGRRITTSEQMDIIVSAVAKTQLRQISLFNSSPQIAPLPSIATSLVWGNWLIAQPLGVHEGVDFELSGKVRKIDTDSINQLLNAGHIVAFHSLATSRLGNLLNLSSEDIAGALAQQLDADKLIIFTKLSQLQSYIAPGQHIDSTTLQLSLPSVSEQWQKSLLQLAINACRNKIRRVHLIDCEEDGALLKELFTRDGSGLMVNDDSYEIVKQADPADVPAIHELIKPMEQQGMLRSRNITMLEQNIQNFHVLKYDKAIIGCAALFPLEAEASAELSCFVIAPQYQGKSKGYALLQAIEKHACNQGIQTLVVLTTQTKDWFEGHGFNLADSKQWSHLIKTTQPDRNARILTKQIGK